MVSDTPNQRSILVETTVFRQQADRLLNRLIENRNTIEQRIQESGRRDPMKSITGHSAMDEAIDTTRALISNADELLIEVNASLSMDGSMFRTEAKPSAIAVST